MRKLSKITAMMIAIIMILSLAACGGSNSAAQEAIEILRSGKFSFDMDAEGMKGVMAIDGGNFAMTAGGDDFVGEDVEVRLVYKDGVTYMIVDEWEALSEVPQMNTIMKEALEMFDFSTMDTKRADSGKAEIDGKTMSYEVFADEKNEAIKVFLEDGKVYAIVDYEDYDDFKMTNLSKTIPSGIFDIPTNYRDLAEVIEEMQS